MSDRNHHTPGYIDLSKRKANQDDKEKARERYEKAKAVHSIMANVSAACNVTVEDLYKMFGWELYRKYKHAYDAFRLMVT